jgi:carbon storage regulator CsrA
MLVLSRKSGESVQIGDSIEVRVLEVSGGKVKLGFSAPPHIAIQRNEIRGVAPKPPLVAWVGAAAFGELCAT